MHTQASDSAVAADSAMQATLVILFCLATPLLVMWLTWRSRLLRKVGEIILAYVVGCVVGLTGVITPEAHGTMTVVASATIPLAIPLMLLSSDVRAWAHLAPGFVKSTLCGVAGCIAAVTLGFVLFGDGSAENAKVGGMLTGLYTGGTANQASLKVALGISDGTYLLSHSYSIVVSAVYLLIVIVFGQRLLSRVLPRFEDSKSAVSEGEAVEDHSGELFWGLFGRDNLPDLGKGLALTVVIVAAGGAAAYGVSAIVEACGSTADVTQAVFILAISLFAVVAACDKRVRRIKRTYEAGSFFILIFSVAVSAQVSTSMFGDVSPRFFAFITVATLGALAFHILLNALLRIDTDTTLVTSIALLCSPPFVPVMAGALDNKAVIGPGIAVGLFGYATGTYIGFGVAHMLLSLI